MFTFIDKGDNNHHKEVIILPDPEDISLGMRDVFPKLKHAKDKSFHSSRGYLEYTVGGIRCY